jgi:flagellar biogenesis protein FliO
MKTSLIIIIAIIIIFALIVFPLIISKKAEKKDHC